jgi:hypothetical protein
MLSLSLTHTHSLTRTLSHSPAHTYRHTLTLTRTLTFTPTLSHIHTRTLTLTHTLSHARTHAQQTIELFELLGLVRLSGLLGDISIGHFIILPKTSLGRVAPLSV